MLSKIFAFEGHKGASNTDKLWINSIIPHGGAVQSSYSDLCHWWNSFYWVIFNGITYFIGCSDQLCVGVSNQKISLKLNEIVSKRCLGPLDCIEIIIIWISKTTYYCSPTEHTALHRWTTDILHNTAATSEMKRTYRFLVLFKITFWITF